MTFVRRWRSKNSFNLPGDNIIFTYSFSDINKNFFFFVVDEALWERSATKLKQGTQRNLWHINYTQ